MHQAGGGPLQRHGEPAPASVRHPPSRRGRPRPAHRGRAALARAPERGGGPDQRGGARADRERLPVRRAARAR
jgi:hypothetical protein